MASENPFGRAARYGNALSKPRSKGRQNSWTWAGITRRSKCSKLRRGASQTLNELVSPDYLPRLPEPPTGMKYDYNPQTGELKIVNK